MRGYQAIFVPLAAVRSPGYSPLDSQPAVYLYIAALEVIVLDCRGEGRLGITEGASTSDRWGYKAFRSPRRRAGLD